MDKGLLNFDIKTGMKNIIGRDLITDDFIAIYELVKNSYDAYADTVKIIFNKDEIIIADNGKGMSKNDLEKKWFAVAYSAKKDKTEDKDLSRNTHLNNLKSRRFYAGAKGVGRFSCDRLGSKLELITSKIDIEETFKVDVDWGEFEKDAQQSFDSIQIPFESIENDNIFPKNKPHGTILKIQSLNSNWDIHKLRELRRSLEKLINPFSKENSFTIQIEAKHFVQFDNNSNTNLKINGAIDNSILKVLDLKTTQIDLVLKDKIITTKIIDRGTLIYHIEEPNKYLSLIDDLEINLYFLNRSAKINFGRLMDIEPVKYGNVFLFKNGFRVQPYGNVGDDSWELDNRKQQGYNRFLGTRDLFGKVDLITENFNEFKEVSSRAGGLVETSGKKVLFDLFKEKAFLRLERYVVGVLWGEAFKRKNYFLDNEIAQQFRAELQNDKDKDSYEDALNNLGSKIDFVNLIRTLSDDKDIKIISYNRELVNLVNEKLDIIQPKFISDLEKIAEKTNDVNLLNQIKLTEESFNKILKEKEEAEKREIEERNKRIEAEKLAELEKLKREEAERKRREEEDRRRKAELETLKKEKERAEAELAKLKAEQKAKQEEEKNKNLTEKNSLLSQEVSYFKATRKTLTGDDAEQLVHSIDLYVGNAASFLKTIFEKEDGFSNKVKEELYFVKSNLDKALKVSQIILKSDFDYKSTNHKVDLAKYIDDYFNDCSIARKGTVNFKVNNNTNHLAYLSTLDIDIIIDNLISNSIKANSSNILIDLYKSDDKLVMDYYDDGMGLPDKFINNKEAIFNLGTRDSEKNGSGIGMYDINKRLKDLNATITVLNNNTKLKGAGFKIKF